MQRLNGIQDEKKTTLEVLPPRSCTRCRTYNPNTNRFCFAGSFVLVTEAATELTTTTVARRNADAVLDVVIDDPEVRELLARKTRALKRT